MKSRQLEHQEIAPQNAANKPAREVILFLDGLRTPENIAGIFRLAECFAVSKIYINVETELLISKSFRSISRIHEKHLQIEQIDEKDVEQTLIDLKEESYELIALEYTNDSTSIRKAKFSDKIVLILGNERHGVPNQHLSICQQSLHIDMFGKISSLNVQQACSIALFLLQS